VESIFKELGASTPVEISLDKIKPDRRELDKTTMGEMLGLTDEEQLEVYRAAVDLVKSRIEKARSFVKRKTEGGNTYRYLVKTLMDKVSNETPGKFYRENMIPHKPLVTKILPGVSTKVKFAQQLSGWRLYSGETYIECSLENEARYYKVFL